MESFAKARPVKCRITPFGNMFKYNEYMKRAYEESRKNAISAWKAVRDVILDSCR